MFPMMQIPRSFKTGCLEKVLTDLRLTGLYSEKSRVPNNDTSFCTTHATVSLLVVYSRATPKKKYYCYLLEVSSYVRNLFNKITF